MCLQVCRTRAQPDNGKTQLAALSARRLAARALHFWRTALHNVCKKINLRQEKRRRNAVGERNGIKSYALHGLVLSIAPKSGLLGRRIHVHMSLVVRLYSDKTMREDNAQRREMRANFASSALCRDSRGRKIRQQPSGKLTCFAAGRRSANYLRTRRTRPANTMRRLAYMRIGLARLGTRTLATKEMLLPRKSIWRSFLSPRSASVGTATNLFSPSLSHSSVSGRRTETWR